MTIAAALVLLAQSPPVAVSNSPPPIVAVPVHPGTPGYAIPAPFPPPPPSPPAATIVRQPQHRRSPQDYVTPDEYPASALARNEEGRVAFRLDVGPNGRVTGCAITGSSGSSALDSATCAIMVRRARFTPAGDSNGMPAPGQASGEIEWVLPEKPGAERGP